MIKLEQIYIIVHYACVYIKMGCCCFASFCYGLCLWDCNWKCHNGTNEMNLNLGEKKYRGEKKIAWIDSTTHWRSYDFKDPRFDIWLVFSLFLSVSANWIHGCTLHLNFFSSFCFCIGTYIILVKIFHYLFKINHYFLIFILFYIF